MSSLAKPIGIFDSGVGGLTVYKELADLLPQESFVYLGDTARIPYGTRSKETVLKYSLQDSLFLMDRGVKMIVIACNTASAMALSYLQDRLRVPVVGVIEPGAQAALAVTQNKRVGIIGTEGTIRSQAYEKALQDRDSKVYCLARSTPLFVPLVEEALSKDEVLDPIFQHYLNDFSKEGIDTLILGCTHFPILKEKLNKYFQNKVQLIDSAQATAKVVKAVLEQKQLAHRGPAKKSSLFVTDAADRVQRIAHYFLGDGTVQIEKVDI